MEGNIGLGQYIPCNSLLHSLDPRSKIVITFILVLAAFMAVFPWRVSLVFLISITLVVLSRISIRIYVRALKPFLYLILITAVLQMVFIGGREMVDLKLFVLTEQGLEAAGSLSLRLIIILLVVQVLIFTTSPMALTGGLERLLSPLKYIRFPVHELIMIMTISLRFMPLYLEEWERIKKAQMSRGVDYNSGTLLIRAQRLVSILVPLMRISFQRAIDLAVAIESRCYQGGQGRTYLNELRMRMIDYVYMVAVGGGALVALF